MAKELDVSREAVSKWLNGATTPRPDKLLKLALLFDLHFDQLIVKNLSDEPVIAFRKRGATKTNESHIAHAKDMGNMLKPLVPFLPYDKFTRPATLKKPVNEYSYLQKVAAKLRAELGVNLSDELDFHHLIKKFNALQTVLIPVLWGSKEKHENALHIFLPDSMTTWVYLNLDSEVHDFKFWMAHELGHIHAPDLRGDEGEDFADSFAGALLFPEPLAKNLYEKLSRLQNIGAQVNNIKSLAERYTISPITVYQEINKYAQHHRMNAIDLGNGIYGAATNINKKFRTVSETLFDGERPTPAKYIEISEQSFDSPFFRTLRDYLDKYEKSAGYVRTILDVPLLDAKGIYVELS